MHGIIKLVAYYETPSIFNVIIEERKNIAYLDPIDLEFVVEGSNDSRLLSCRVRVKPACSFVLFIKSKLKQGCEEKEHRCDFVLYPSRVENRAGEQRRNSSWYESRETALRFCLRHSFCKGDERKSWRLQYLVPIRVPCATDQSIIANRTTDKHLMEFWATVSRATIHFSFYKRRPIASFAVLSDPVSIRVSITRFALSLSSATPYPLIFHYFYLFIWLDIRPYRDSRDS